MVEVLSLKNGFYELPKGKLCNFVTCLEMLQKPTLQELALPAGYMLSRVDPLKLDEYRAVFRKIGENLMWFSRMIMPDAALSTILNHKDVESYVLTSGVEPVGLMELDFRDLSNCELVFFGLTPDQIGTGISKHLMNAALCKAWSKPIKRLWVHTCHYDHPNAVRFYCKSGFTPYKHMIEIHDDARLTGHLPRGASPQIALLEP